MEKSCPFISVIIPTYERAGQLSVCLGALAAQDYPRDRFEVLVVDDGSATSPEGSVGTFRHQLNVRLLKQLHSGPAAARNHGTAHAKGAFLAFTDDDCAPVQVGSRVWRHALSHVQIALSAAGRSTSFRITRTPPSLNSLSITSMFIGIPIPSMRHSSPPTIWLFQRTASKP